MKFFRIKETGSVIVSCHDSIMAQLLNLLAGDEVFTPGQAQQRRTGEPGATFGYMFSSGARIGVTSKRHTYAIFGYAEDERDTKLAVQELKMLAAVLKAQNAYRRIRNEFCNYGPKFEIGRSKYL